MVASTAIKYFVHTNTNAPQLDNVQGSMITVLDACLVNGLTLGAVDSITATGTTVTVNFSTTHNLLRFQVIKIAGAAQAEYNGEHRILSVPTTSSVTFGVATAPSVSPATGAIVASLPPVGWSLPFTATGKRAYKNTDIESPYLRVVDMEDPAWTTTYAKYAKVGICEEMVDIDTMLGHQAPYDASNPDKNWVGSGTLKTAFNGWAKWFYASQHQEGSVGYQYNAPTDGKRQWILVGNGETFYMLCKSSSTVDTRFMIYGFGKLSNPLTKVTASPYFISASDDYQNASSYENGGIMSLCSTNVSAKLMLLRNYKNEAVSVNGLSLVLFNSSSASAEIGYTNLFKAPDAYTPIISGDYFIREGANIIRGTVPIFKWPYQVKPYTHKQGFSEDGQMFIAFDCAAGAYAGQVLCGLGAL